MDISNIRAIIARMTLEEKAGLCSGAYSFFSCWEAASSLKYG